MVRSGIFGLLILMLTGIAAAQSPAVDPVIFRSAVSERFGACPFTLHSLNPETGATTAITNFPEGNIASAAWSPDGTQIAFFHDTLNTCGMGIPFGTLYIMNADGTEQRALLPESSVLTWAWSPDGKQIAYEDGDAITDPAMQTLADIVIVDVASGAELQRWPGGGMKWSPDSSHIVFARQQPDHDLFVDVYVVDVAAGELRQLTDWPGNVESYDWTPDSQQVTFMYYELPNNQVVADLYTVAREGGQPINLTNTGAGLSVFAYSPDGLLIAYEGRFGDFFLMNADGSNQQRYSSGPQHGRRGTYPVWSPDGSKVAYEFQPADFSNAYHPYTLYILDVTTGIVTIPDASIGTEGGFVWSPDGRQIIYRGNVDTELEIYSVPADGSTPPRNLTNRPGFFDTTPLWQPGSAA
ncbi:MAG: hypothetical protein K8L97_17035 [Anaerolineae bacterium]|nr:hypothetical protein [Anaerolineae bacterium]